MSAAEKIIPDIVAMPWQQIRAQYPNAWVCLLDVETAADGAICTARVLGHARSMRDLLAQLDTPPPGAIVVHTGGRPLTTPRFEMTDEIRNIVRPRR